MHQWQHHQQDCGQHPRWLSSKQPEQPCLKKIVCQNSKKCRRLKWWGQRVDVLVLYVIVIVLFHMFSCYAIGEYSKSLFAVKWYKELYIFVRTLNLDKQFWIFFVKLVHESTTVILLNIHNFSFDEVWSLLVNKRNRSSLSCSSPSLACPFWASSPFEFAAWKYPNRIKIIINNNTYNSNNNSNTIQLIINTKMVLFF